VIFSDSGSGICHDPDGELAKGVTFAARPPLRGEVLPCTWVELDE